MKYAKKRYYFIFNIIFENFSFILTIKSQLLFLKGYENLQRIITNNPDGFSLAFPNNFDHACFIEMSDHFWGPRSNYFTYFKIEIVTFYLDNLLTLFIYILAYFKYSYQWQNAGQDRCRYKYRYRSQFPRRERSSHQDRSRSRSRRQCHWSRS